MYVFCKGGFHANQHAKIGPKHVSICKSLLWASSQSESPVDSTKVKFELGQPQLCRPGQHCPAASLPLPPLPLSGHILPSAWAPARADRRCADSMVTTLSTFIKILYYILESTLSATPMMELITLGLTLGSC